MEFLIKVNYLKKETMDFFQRPQVSYIYRWKFDYEISQRLFRNRKLLRSVLIYAGFYGDGLMTSYY